MQLYSLAHSCQGQSLPLTSTAALASSHPSSATTTNNGHTTARDVRDHPLDGDQPPTAQGQYRYNRCVLGPATSATNTHLTCIRSSRCVRRSGEEEGRSVLPVRNFVGIVARTTFMSWGPRRARCGRTNFHVPIGYVQSIEINRYYMRAQHDTDGSLFPPRPRMHALLSSPLSIFRGRVSQPS